MLSRIERTVEEHRLLLPGTRVLVAVSGGPDSTALFHALRALSSRLRITLEAAIIDHQLRPASAAEAAEVKRALEAMDVPCISALVDVRAARRRHGSWQQAARDARLQRLEAIAEERGCARIALGHTADDQAETVFFRIVRGTGLAGLAGIPYARGPFVRPLLDVRRAEVLRFLDKRKIPYLSDPSNEDRRYARARVRHEWLPLLARENPRVAEALIALAAEVRQRVETGDLAPRPDGQRLSRRAARTIDALAARAAGTQEVAIEGGAVRIEYGTVTFAPRPRADAGREGEPDSLPIPGPGHYRLGEEAAIVIQAGGEAPPADAALFDADALVWPLVLRRWRPGDRMRPRGGRGTRKLSDLFIDAKIPRDRRARLPLVAGGDGQILFVPGLRPSAVGTPSPTARRLIQVRAV